MNCNKKEEFNTVGSFFLAYPYDTYTPRDCEEKERVKVLDKEEIFF